MGAVVGLAPQLDITTVAEGVETPEQLQVLAELGCDLVQGFLVDRPRPADELAAAWDRGPDGQEA